MDDWMLDSLQKYESLYMYELHHPTQCLDWTKDGTAICVAGFSVEENNEILQLSIPEKLLSVEKQTLCARRDFKMINGGLTKAPVTQLKSLEPSKYLLASCGSGGVIDLWSEDTVKSDMLRKADEIHLKAQTESMNTSTPQQITPGLVLDHTHDHPSALLTGSAHSLATVQLVDVNTKHCLFELCSHGNKKETTPLHALSFVSGTEGCVFVTCCGEGGAITLWDTREETKMDRKITSLEERSSSKSSAAIMAPSSQQTFAMAVSKSCSLADAKVAILSSCGEMLLYDTRNIDVPLSKCSVKSEDESTLFRSRFAVGRSLRLCVQFSPSTKSLVSVSGVNKGIQVYDTSTWTDHTNQVPIPVFSHDGHEEESPTARVLVHSWQVGVAKTTIFSADSEGSLHAWEWK